MNDLVLTKRLQSVADMVTIGNCVCDVGCDHGYVSIYLVQKEIAPRAIAMDVRSGPLSQFCLPCADDDGRARISCPPSSSSAPSSAVSK